VSVGKLQLEVFGHDALAEEDLALLLKDLALDHGSLLDRRHDSPQAWRCSQYMVAMRWQCCWI
jgi:hypothetical protein